MSDFKSLKLSISGFELGWGSVIICGGVAASFHLLFSCCGFLVKGRGNIVVVDGVPSVGDVADTESLLHGHESVGDEPQSINNLVEDVGCVDLRLLHIINDMLEVIPPGSLDAGFGVLDGHEELLGLIFKLG